jgi:uncharacterized protein (TIGR00730 family)
MSKLKIAKKNLTVFCSSKYNLDNFYYIETEKFIKKINPDIFSIVYGGGKSGIMGSVRNSWLENSGTIISSNIFRFVDPDIADDYVFENLIDRQKKLIELADGFIVLPGGYGTHFEALEAITKNDIGESSKPIFILNLNGFFNNMICQIEWLTKEGFVTRGFDKLNVFVDSDSTKLAEKINNYF